jgi:4-amino-4-deoxy-L-arabinose transferase-like glycosyltransferase
MKRLLLFLVLRALVLIFLMEKGGVGLAPDEAQYWTWSQALDWGYYSKPPAIAWQIWLSTILFGDSIFGVRLGALLIGSLICLAVYGAARCAKLSQDNAFWTAVVAAVAPIGIYLSVASTTDGGAILFFTCAVALLLRGMEREKGPNYALIGLCIGLGALFKWTAFVFWPIVLVHFLFFKELRSWRVLMGIALSLIALLPSLYWNWSHDWATFKHVGTTVGSVKKGNFFSFFAAQIGLLSPIFFILLLMSYFFLKKECNRALALAAGFPACALIYLTLSCFKKMQPNWAAYLYPSGLLLIPWVCNFIKKGKMLLSRGCCLSFASVAFLFFIPSWQQKLTCPLPYSLNPFRQSIGWSKLPEILSEAGYKSSEHFLFADKYQNASLLSFYGPDQKRAYYFNISATRKNQFSYWPQMEEKEVGNTGYFAVLENVQENALDWYQDHYVHKLSPFFEKVECKGRYPLFIVAGVPVKYALVFVCTSYKGTAPPTSSNY